MNRYETYKSLREEYPVFIYEGYEVKEEADALHIAYDFHVPGLTKFRPTWVFPKKSKDGRISEKLSDLSEDLKKNKTLRKLIFSLGMIELVSYWKAACPKKVILRTKKGEGLSDKELSWWKTQYFHGLGEFFYTNEIPLCEEGFMEIVTEDTEGEAESLIEKFVSFFKEDEGEPVMIPVGGGKDSVVTLELLKDLNEGNYCYMIGGRGATFQTAETAGFPADRVIIPKRSLDPALLRLNAEGFLNGHTPFSAVVAFSSVLTAYLYGIPYIALSNEGSANESTVSGSTVNHQYSKSFDFERDFYTYEKEWIGSGVYYFSLLRGWTEYRIASYFAKRKKYHKIFRSCNVGSKEDKWCGHCPKCLFVNLILGPFLEREEITEIFGRDMLSDPSLLTELKKLVGELPEKPFECVGSREEVNIAICETIKRLEKEGKELPLLFKEYMETESYLKYKEEKAESLLGFSEENHIPEVFKDRVR